MELRNNVQVMIAQTRVTQIGFFIIDFMIVLNKTVCPFGQENQFQQNGQIGIFSAYTVNEDPYGPQKDMIRSTKYEEIHQAFIGIRSLTFHYSQSGVSLIYAPNAISTGGEAEGDKFYVDSNTNLMINDLALTYFDDSILINMPSIPDLNVNVLSGQDTIKCYSNCKIQLDQGKDRIITSNSTVVIQNFKVNEDIIDITSQNMVYSRNYLNIKYYDSNSSLLIVLIANKSNVQIVKDAKHVIAINALNAILNLQINIQNKQTNTCKACGDGCKICKAQSCLSCKENYAYIPRLSLINCYIDLKTQNCNDGVNFRANKKVSKAMKDILGECFLSSDGSVNKLEASIQALTDRRLSASSIVTLFESSQPQTKRLLATVSVGIDSPLYQKYTTCYASTSQLTSNIYNQDFNQLVTNPSLKQSQYSSLQLVETFLNFNNPPKRVSYPILSISQSLNIPSTFTDQEKRLRSTFMSCLTMTLSHLSILDQYGKRFNDPIQTQNFLTSIGVISQSKVIPSAIDITKIGFTQVTEKTQFTQIEIAKSIKDIDKILILKLKNSAEYVLATNGVLDDSNNVKVIQPTLKQEIFLGIDQFDSYIEIIISSYKTKRNRELLANFLIGKPFYHSKFTFLKGNQYLQYLLVEWRNIGQVQTQQLLLFDLNKVSSTYKSLVTIDLDNPEYSLSQVDIYLNTRYKLDAYDQTIINLGTKAINYCSDDEIQSFLGMSSPACYKNKMGGQSICYEEPMTSCTSSLKYTEQKCQGLFKARRLLIENQLYNNSIILSASKVYPNRTCSLIKLGIMFGSEAIFNNQVFMSYFESEDYENAALALLSQKESCLMDPYQTLTIYKTVKLNQGQFIPNRDVELLITITKLKQIMQQLSEEKARIFIPYLKKYMIKTDISTPRRIAIFLAQIAHESAQFVYLKEIADGSQYEGRIDLGNTEVGDGVKFKGRGLIQITGRSNYKKYGNLMNLDLINNPVLLEQVENAVYVSCLFWQDRKLNRLADQDDFLGVTKKINGGTNGLSDRQMFYERAKNAFGL
ncbi:glycoside hydrolase family protein [Stylonychia lemnae]|uniref:Glycoside hydrolase family protein n=1 Tax=Stylonychia lemnae TaxID=5949 RepID=A0A078AT44_STYLE|nr:glycoside hydrolase family protein [Stylonychia lemnae]|eukprot:CDW85625.1 glycoside hydrolase family protein [Stylonychia lemnae]